MLATAALTGALASFTPVIVHDSRELTRLAAPLPVAVSARFAAETVSRAKCSRVRLRRKGSFVRLVTAASGVLHVGSRLEQQRASRQRHSHRVARNSPPDGVLARRGRLDALVRGPRSAEPTRSGMMGAMTSLALMVLDSIVDDPETVATTRDHGEVAPYGLALVDEWEVVEAVGRRLDDGLVEALDAVRTADGPRLVAVASPRRDPASLRTYWLRPSAEGRRVWAAWPDG